MNVVSFFLDELPRGAGAVADASDDLAERYDIAERLLSPKAHVIPVAEQSNSARTHKKRKARTMTPQWKRFYFARRNAALTEVEFPIRWRLHAELGGTFPDGLRRHPQIHYGLVQAIHGGSDRHRYDGIGILWLGSPEWADRASDDPTHRPTMRQDELRVFDRPVYDCALLAQEQVSKSGSLGHAALLRFFRRADLVSDEIFGDASASVGHALAALPEFVSTVGRCTWGTAVRAPTVDFDAFMEFRFDSVKQAAAALSSAAFTVAARTPMDFAASAGTMDQDVLYLVEICHERLAPAASN